MGELGLADTVRGDRTEGPTVKLVKAHPRWGVVATALALVVLVAAAVVFNRGGVGSLNSANVRWATTCHRVDEDTVAATLLYTGRTERGSISLGVTLQALDGRTGDVIGETTKRFTASGSFRKTLAMAVDFNGADAGSTGVECAFTLPHDGWHRPGH